MARLIKQMVNYSDLTPERYRNFQDNPQDADCLNWLGVKL